MPDLLLLRHGQSQWNLENRFTGWIDVPLAPRGEAEARVTEDAGAPGGTPARASPRGRYAGLASAPGRRWMTRTQARRRVTA